MSAPTLEGHLVTQSIVIHNTLFFLKIISVWTCKFSSPRNSIEKDETRRRLGIGHLSVRFFSSRASAKDSKTNDISVPVGFSGPPGSDSHHATRWDRKSSVVLWMLHMKHQLAVYQKGSNQCLLCSLRYHNMKIRVKGLQIIYMASYKGKVNRTTTCLHIQLRTMNNVFRGIRQWLPSSQGDPQVYSAMTLSVARTGTGGGRGQGFDLDLQAYGTRQHKLTALYAWIPSAQDRLKWATERWWRVE